MEKTTEFNFREINERLEKAKGALFQGRDESDLEKIVRAEEEYRALLEQDPNHFLIHYWLARVYDLKANLLDSPDERRKCIEAGVEAASKAIELNDGHAGSHLARSGMCGRMIRLTKGGLVKWGSQAGAELARAKQLHPEDEPYYYYISGRAAIFSPALFGGSYRTAITQLTRGTELDPNDPLMATWLAIALGKQSETDRAEEVVAEVVRRWPQFRYARKVLKRLEAGEELIPET